ncbi:unnamed protein product [Hydatigera taeniaeformis]|uniref:LysR_substrate domain-containing protein n=1 Tax=Hydatigena taeniaeformis TaxID=6205 RepID=A0A0R3X0P5_HYDTA|nr:unnamed protein product [Hydatigera taeniaeformis]
MEFKLTLRRGYKKAICFHISCPDFIAYASRIGRRNVLKLYLLEEESLAVPEWLTLAEGVRPHPLTEKVVVPGTLNRLVGMLSVAKEELPDCPLYFQSDRLCATLRTPVPKIALIRSAFLYAFSSFRCEQLAA